MGVMMPPYLTPCGNCRAMASPTTLPSAAPILKTGMKIPDGTGTVELIIEKMNWKIHKINEYPNSQDKARFYILTVNATKPSSPINTSVLSVDQCLTMFLSSTVRSLLVHVKFVKRPWTWSWVFRSPAMYLPRPSGNETEDTTRETMPGYKKRLKIIIISPMFVKVVWLFQEFVIIIVSRLPEQSFYSTFGRTTRFHFFLVRLFPINSKLYRLLVFCNFQFFYHYRRCNFPIFTKFQANIYYTRYIHFVFCRADSGAAKYLV